MCVFGEKRLSSQGNQGHVEILFFLVLVAKISHFFLHVQPLVNLHQSCLDSQKTRTERILSIYCLFFFLHQFEQRVTFTRSPKRADLCCLCVSSPLLPVKQSSLSIYLFALPATSSNFSSEVKHARGLCYYLGIAVAKSLYA